jgi:hypothetical protein
MKSTDYTNGEIRWNVFQTYKSLFRSEKNIIRCLLQKDRLCGLVVGVPGYTTEMYCASCIVFL